jgi:O-antigen ligase
MALATGTVALLLLGDRSIRRALAGPAAGTLVAFAGLLPSLPSGRAANLPAAVGGLAAGLGIAAVAGRSVPGGSRWRPFRALQGRSRPAVLAAVTVGLALAAAVPLALAGARPIGRALSAVADVRVTMTSAHRLEAASAALTQFSRSPVVGTGPGAGQVSWHDPSGASHTMVFLHDEYLQVLLEFGTVGAVLLLGVLAVGGITLWRARPAGPGGGPPARATWVGVCAAVLAFAVHSGLDFLWHLPALPLLMAAVFALPGPVPDTDRVEAGSARIAVDPPRRSVLS